MPSFTLRGAPFKSKTYVIGPLRRPISVLKSASPRPESPRIFAMPSERAGLVWRDFESALGAWEPCGEDFFGLA